MNDIARAWAIRIPGWCLWNIGTWGNSGWVIIGALRTDRGADGRRRHFQLVWNGTRLAYGKGSERLQYHFPNADRELTAFLREALPPGAGEPTFASAHMPESAAT